MLLNVRHEKSKVLELKCSNTEGLIYREQTPKKVKCNPNLEHGFLRSRWKNQ